MSEFNKIVSAFVIAGVFLAVVIIADTIKTVKTIMQNDTEPEKDIAHNSVNAINENLIDDCKVKDLTTMVFQLNEAKAISLINECVITPNQAKYGHFPGQFYCHVTEQSIYLYQRSENGSYTIAWLDSGSDEWRWLVPKSFLNPYEIACMSKLLEVSPEQRSKYNDDDKALVESGILWPEPDTPPYRIDDNTYWAPIYDKENPEPVGFIVPNGKNENEFTIHIGSAPELGYGVYKQCDFPFDNPTMNRLSQKWKSKE